MKKLWKNLPYWLEGGLISVGAIMIIYLAMMAIASLTLLLNIPFLIITMSAIIGIIHFFLFLPGEILFFLSDGILSSRVTIYGSTILFYFIIGSIIGWIVGKKHSNSRKNVKY